MSIMAVASSSRPPRKKALLIGIKETPDYDTLEHAYRDVVHVRKLITEFYGYAKRDVTVMTDSSHQEDSLKATRENILRQLQLFVEDVQPGDHFFFCFSGHSTQFEAQDDADEQDGLDEAIVACDGEAILDNDLKAILVDRLPAGSTLVAIWDTCHSGTILDLPHYMYGTNDSPKDAESELSRTYIEHSKFVPNDQSWTSRGAGSGGTKPSHRGCEARALSVKHGSRPIARGSLSSPTISSHRSAQSDVSPGPSKVASQISSGLPAASTDNEQRPTKLKKACVLCISACQDDQLAWDDVDTNSSMTDFLIDILKDNKHPSLKQLISRLSQSIDEVSAKRYAEWASNHHRHDSRISLGSESPETSSNIEADDEDPFIPQNIVVSSEEILDMEASLDI